MLTESPTFSGALGAFQWAGARVVGVPIDHEGVQSDLLEEALIRHRPKLIYVIPTFHNPTGAVLSRERRQRLLELAARFRTPVLESDVYGELFFEGSPPPSLKAMDTAGVVIYQGSMSKITVPGLRVGWLVAPPGAMLPLTAAKAFEDLHTAPLLQRLAAEYLQSGHLEPHLATVRKGYRTRRDALVTGLRRHASTLGFRIPTGGYYLWAELPPPLTAEQLVPSAIETGVAFRPGTHFMPGEGGERHVRLSFSCMDPATILEGTRRLGEALERSRGRLAPPSRRQPAAPVSVV